MSSYNNNYKSSGKRFNQDQPREQARPGNNSYAQPRDQPRDQDQGYQKRYTQEQPRDQGRPYGEKSSNYGGDSYQGKGYTNDNRSRQQEGGNYQKQQYRDEGYGGGYNNRSERPAYPDNQKYVPPYQKNSGSSGYQNGPRPETYGNQKPYGGYQDQGKRITRDEVYDPEQNQAQRYQKDTKPFVAQIVQPCDSEIVPAQKVFSKPTAQAFSNRPQPSETRVQTAHSQQQTASGQMVKVLSNQYRLKLGGVVQVFQYKLEILGMDMFDASFVQQVVKFKRSAIEKSLGLNVVSGQSIYLLEEIEEDVKFDASFRSGKYTILIDKSTQSIVQLNGDFSNSDNSVSQNLINIIIKQAFRETNLKQIGKVPRFFDVQNPIELQRQQLRILSGFKASAFQSQLGCTLVMDSIFKFMSTKTCLQRIIELKDESQGNQNRFEQIARLEFCEKSIIADWGNQRTYFVSDVVFNVNPMSMTFEHQGDTISVAEYFLKCYNKRITQLKQPMFLVKVAEKSHYLPTEFCLLDGVPDSVRKGPGMRDALAQTRIDPQEKIRRIQKMVTELFNQKAIKDWNLVIEQEPIQISTNVLSTPQMISQNQIIRCDENTLRKLPITKAAHLLEGEWIMVYEKSDRVYQIADTIYNDMMKASNQLKLKVEMPAWIELSREGNKEEFEEQLCRYMSGEDTDRQFRHPTMVVIVLQRENNYSMFKEILLKYRIPSQVVTCRNGQKFNLSKATNILRQINSKAGADLYNMKFPESLNKKRTMLIGIDVCHSGPQSIVGFSASINKEMSQYYSDFLIQKKGQEIVQDNMKESIEEAIKTFSKKHNGEFPTNFVIYRDGVGDAQRDQVLSAEIPQFEAAINKLYNKAAEKPEITVVVVNKRISQRFFVTDAQGRLSNPPSGCIIDKGLVENQGAESKKFDFFLTPASATQGCVLPTHFFVPKNDSSLSKIDIQHLTFALCHFYFNWAGPIKVPAPCQYAHKIAEFYMTIGATKRRPQNNAQNCSREAIQMKMQCEKNVEPLNHKLHFL